MKWAPEQLQARAALIDEMIERWKGNSGYADTMRMEAWALRTAAAIAGAPRYRHKKRGTTYLEVGRGKLQSFDPGGLGDLDPVVIYRADEDGTLWVRPVDEFEDGRFERIQPGDDIEKCIACDVALNAGDMVLNDANGGLIHASCCGPERESNTGADGGPLKDGEAIPEPFEYRKEVR